MLFNQQFVYFHDDGNDANSLVWLATSTTWFIFGRCVVNRKEEGQDKIHNHLHEVESH